MCGAGWFRNGDNCYRVHTNTAPWRLAKQTCQNADPTADLLWITTKAEEAFIKSELLCKFHGINLFGMNLMETNLIAWEQILYKTQSSIPNSSFWKIMASEQGQ
jgi:hypothetical protein